MATRHERKKWQNARLLIEKQFEKHRRQNLVRAQPGELKFAIVLDNLKPSFNIGKIFRSADAFGACELHLIGIDFFDPSPSKGSFKWVPAIFHKTFEECYQNLHERGYTLFVMEPEEGMELHKSTLPEKAAFVMGHEEFGISFDKKYSILLAVIK